MRNHQVGTPLATELPPIFATCYRGGETIDITGTRVRGNTWTEEDATKDEAEEDETESVFNITNYSRGFNNKCDLFPSVGYQPVVGDVLEESAASGALAAAAGVEFFPFEGDKRRFVLRAPISKKQFSKRPKIFSVSLYRGPDLDTTQIQADTES